jgi:hypothetical protein
MRRGGGEVKETPMKAMALLSVAVAAVMSYQISAALSQEACVKEYSVCMDGCTKRSGKSMQDSCFQSCEGRNNFCAERVYGKRPSPAAAEAAQASVPAQSSPQPVYQPAQR